jgi:2-oxoisovalerate dehydrogenase E1 component beta subunit
MGPQTTSIHPILRVAAPDVPAIPFSAPLEKFYMPSVEKIMTAMERVAQY